MKKIGRGISDYHKMVTNNNYLVDKTMLIKDFIDNGDEVVLITRPRRFGKTLNMSMLSEFFDIRKNSKKIFVDTKIYNTEYMKFINQYPIIFISFKDCKGSKNQLIMQLMSEIKNEFQKYYFIFQQLDVFDQNDYNNIIHFLMNVNDNSLELISYSLKFLTKKLYDYYHKKVIVLIDEYDTPYIEAKSHHFYDDIHSSLSILLSSLLKDNIYLEKAMLTGIQRVIKENIFSDLNNITVCSVLDEKFSEYFGFSEIETKEFLKYYGLELNNDVKKMYNGYKIGKCDIYNPWSIINYASTGKLDKFWVNTGSNKMIRESINQLNDKELFNKEYDELIFNGNLKTSLDLTTSFQVEPSLESLWGLFVNAGYLTIIEEKKDSLGILYTLSIPNDEVKMEFKVLTADRMKSNINELTNMYKALC